MAFQIGDFRFFDTVCSAISTISFTAHAYVLLGVCGIDKGENKNERAGQFEFRVPAGLVGNRSVGHCLGGGFLYPGTIGSGRRPGAGRQCRRRCDDASTIYFNPAGMTQLPGLQMDSGINLLVPNASLTDTGSVDHSPFAANSLPGGGNGGNPGSATPVPDFYRQRPVADRLAGVGGSTCAHPRPSDLPRNTSRTPSHAMTRSTVSSKPSTSRLDHRGQAERLAVAGPRPRRAIRLCETALRGAGCARRRRPVDRDGRTPDADWAYLEQTGFNGGLLITPDPRPQDPALAIVMASATKSEAR